ncbi:MAG TPA: DUF2066 domain-containing protein [Dokdonella sp.]|uniref:DUF2066 domain-containing protein n=1 Tax=Dokdonella sp. TaxID=2291710 RepID=UPI002D810F3E|nr:DUF2066 domain-containing protein [Dokdonella sp.]HET9033336.1 DUF2066 domain-containing protein [Dokdonella sp.]
MRNPHATGPAVGFIGVATPGRALGGSQLALAMRIVTVLAILLMMLPAMAAPATYSGEARVANQSEVARANALKTALAEVVIRLSGDPGILARDNVAEAVAKAEKYVLQYSYRRDTAMDTFSGAEKPQLILVAEFDSAAVDRMLGGLGIGEIGNAANIDATPVEKRIWLSGIHSSADYARGIGYLSRQPLVRQSWPIEARGDGILIRVEIAGDFNRWLGLVDQDGVMQVNSASPPVQGIDATLALSP